jgi:hypothetical protein
MWPVMFYAIPPVVFLNFASWLRSSCLKWFPSFLCNPLMPEFNPSKQCCLPGIFTGDLKFYFLVFGEKKAYLIVFSFKFNEIKFYTMLVNW